MNTSQFYQFAQSHFHLIMLVCFVFVDSHHARGEGTQEGVYLSSSTDCTHSSRFALLPAFFRAQSCDVGTEPTNFAGVVSQQIHCQTQATDNRFTAELDISRFDMTGTHPTLGALSISLDKTRPGVSASLRSVNPNAPFPVIHTTRINVTATAQNLPGVVLQNQGAPLEFTSDPSNSWPPTTNTYTLPIPIVFEDRDHPGSPLMTACPGSVTVIGSTSSIPTTSVWGVVALALLTLAAGTILYRRSMLRSRVG